MITPAPLVILLFFYSISSCPTKFKHWISTNIWRSKSINSASQIETHKIEATQSPEPGPKDHPEPQGQITKTLMPDNNPQQKPKPVPSNLGTQVKKPSSKGQGLLPSNSQMMNPSGVPQPPTSEDDDTQPTRPPLQRQDPLPPPKILSPKHNSAFHDGDLVNVSWTKVDGAFAYRLIFRPEDSPLLTQRLDVEDTHVELKIKFPSMHTVSVTALYKEWDILTEEGEWSKPVEFYVVLDRVPIAEFMPPPEIQEPNPPQKTIHRGDPCRIKWKFDCVVTKDFHVKYADDIDYTIGFKYVHVHDKMEVDLKFDKPSNYSVEVAGFIQKGNTKTYGVWSKTIHITVK